MPVPSTSHFHNLRGQPTTCLSRHGGKVEVQLQHFCNRVLEKSGRSAPCSGCFGPGKDLLPIVQEAEWASGLVWIASSPKQVSIMTTLSQLHLHNLLAYNPSYCYPPLSTSTSKWTFYEGFPHQIFACIYPPHLWPTDVSWFLLS